MSSAVTTLQMGVGGGFLTNLQNSAGLANQTLVWGVVVDTDGNGFASNYDNGFTISDTATRPNGIFLSSSSALTGDRLFISTNLMATGGTGDGSGGLAKPTNVNLAYIADGAAGVSNAGGQAIAIMWFDYTSKTGQTVALGDNYGLYVLPFNTPADTLGGSVAFGSNFIGPDTVRLASNEFGVPIPETSTSLLGAIGALALLRRRRN